MGGPDAQAGGVRVLLNPSPLNPHHSLGVLCVPVSTDDLKAMGWTPDDIPKLGSGHFASVFRVSHTADQFKAAVKIIKKPKGARAFVACHALSSLPALYLVGASSLVLVHVLVGCYAHAE